MNRPGKDDWNHSPGWTTHKGQWDRQGRRILLSQETEQQIIDVPCGGCYVSYYTLSLGCLTEYILRYRETPIAEAEHGH